jgi:hypothetical protein
MTAARRLAAILAAEAVRRAASKTHWRLILPTPYPSSRSDWPLHVGSSRPVSAKKRSFADRSVNGSNPALSAHFCSVPVRKACARSGHSLPAWSCPDPLAAAG